MAPLSKRSLAELIGVHPTLVKELTDFTLFFDITVIDGTRTIEQQKLNVLKKLSQTMNSMHIIQDDGYGHAVDFAPTPQQWENSPPAMVEGRHITQYEVECIACLFAFKAWCAARGIKVRIGADWNNNNLWQDNNFNDLDHVELPVG